MSLPPWSPRDQYKITCCHCGDDFIPYEQRDWDMGSPWPVCLPCLDAYNEGEWGDDD